MKPGQRVRHPLNPDWLGTVKSVYLSEPTRPKRRTLADLLVEGDLESPLVECAVVHWDRTDFPPSVYPVAKLSKAG